MREQKPPAKNAEARGEGRRPFRPSAEANYRTPAEGGRMSRGTGRPTLASSLTLLLMAMSWEMTRAHVALLFPRARQYDLDFLDNARTPAPCGMPRGKCNRRR